MFTDRVKLRIVAGSGGNGLVSWRREPYIPKGGPNGGNGGMGGSVYIEADESSRSLDHLTQKTVIRAKNGTQGGKNRRNGKRGPDYLLRVPPGTLVKSGNECIDLDTPGKRHLLCQGGKGGLGNAFFKSSTHRAPNKCTPGKAGQMVEFEFELKLIADIGLVGMPNAGKTTLLSSLSNKSFKSADYPFTTLSPNLSDIYYDDYQTLRIADIPGIVKNAHKNKGLGLEFLRHIERCNSLLFILDATSETLEDDFSMLMEEIRQYNPEILKKPILALLNKSDLCDEINVSLSVETYTISAMDGSGLETLKKRIKAFI
jgi:GTPase